MQSREYERKHKEELPVIAICYDFDKTLTPDDMQAQGYIQRQQREDDTRMNSIYVTDKGRDIIERTGEIFDAADPRAFKDFSVKELDQFIGYLQRISYNLKSVGSYLNREE